MKALVAVFLFVCCATPIWHAQDTTPLGDVARRSKADSQAYRTAHPNANRYEMRNDAGSGRGESDAGSPLVKAIMAKGFQLDDQGRHEEAIAEYNKALKIQPDYSWAHYDIGIAREGQGRLGEAIAAYKQAVALSESHFEFFVNLGRGLFESHQYVQAEAVLRKGHELFPERLEIMMNLGNSLAGQRKFEEA